MSNNTEHEHKDECRRKLRHETNVLVISHLSDLHFLAQVNLWLSFFAAVYFAINIVCLIVISLPESVPEEVFHNIEFGSAMVFSLVQLLSIMYSPERHFVSPLVLKTVVLLNLVTAVVAAILVFIALETFETASHVVEYTNEFFMALVDMLMAIQLIRGLIRTNKTTKCSSAVWVLCASIVALGLACAQLAVFFGQGFDEDGESLGALQSHYIEFTLGSTSAVITFWYCMDNKFLIDHDRDEIKFECPAEIRGKQTLDIEAGQ